MLRSTLVAHRHLDKTKHLGEVGEGKTPDSGEHLHFLSSLSIKSHKPTFGLAGNARVGFSDFIDMARPRGLGAEMVEQKRIGSLTTVWIRKLDLFPPHNDDYSGSP